MKIVFFDTETIGLPKDYKASYKNLDNWPRMLQIAWTVERDGNILAEHEYIVYPQEFEVPENIAKLTRISQQRAMTEGYGIQTILEEFWEDVYYSDLVVAHNYNFDFNIVSAEFVRGGMEKSPLEDKKSLDTMLTTVNLCKLPGKYGYKWPKLQELHVELFGQEFEEAHDALADIKAMSKCYWELQRVCELVMVSDKPQFVRKI